MDKGVLNFARVKNFQGSGALGPIVTLKDEVPDPQDIDFSTSVNGEVRQRGNTKDMIRGFGEWVEFLSADVGAQPRGRDRLGDVRRDRRGLQQEGQGREPEAGRFLKSATSWRSPRRGSEGP